ncbi:MAG: desulfoferrodoxin [Peptococcaceae bacterium]|jgi:superoxide reductase|nr:desulfoferrodoxin [Peptococcaceae bacterium]
MAKQQKFYLCEHCKNLVGVIAGGGAPLVCCGSPMKELVANTSDGAKEKHVPVVEVAGNQVKVAVGSAAHPMTEEHLITWVYLQTEKGGQRKALQAGEKPEAVFATTGDQPLAVYAYCNLHGLWKTDI